MIWLKEGLLSTSFVEYVLAHSDMYLIFPAFKRLSYLYNILNVYVNLGLVGKRAS